MYQHTHSAMCSPTGVPGGGAGGNDDHHRYRGLPNPADYEITWEDLVIGLHILAVYSGALLALFTVAYCAYKFYRADERKNLARIHFSVLRFNPNILRDIFALASPRAHLPYAATSSGTTGLALAPGYHAAAGEKIRRGACKWRAECEAF
ncbi:hypothetical protein C7M84_009209 [Penaeus vannamei]|uniref:Uncharacterized protein n=1 Tax=Penaeus vannamei TaxID=6689 RepID=A0A423T7I3_PENVA|nr:hypothetical protein C7M84_009209 [Penaeus vannamei]